MAEQERLSAADLEDPGTYRTAAATTPRTGCPRVCRWRKLDRALERRTTAWRVPAKAPN